MPYTAGVFALFTPGNPVVTGTTVASTWANNTLTDIGTGLSTCLLKDGTQTVTANLPMAGFKFTGLGAGANAGESLRYEQLFGAAGATVLGPINWPITTVASAASPDIWTNAGNAISYTGTATATGFAAAPQAGAMRLLVCTGAAVFTAGANVLIQGVASGLNYTASAGDVIMVQAITTTQFRLVIFANSGLPSVTPQTANAIYAGPTSGAAAAPTFRALVAADLVMSPITASASGDVALNVQANYFDIVSVAQANAGTWFASGTVSLASSTADTMDVKLWDGTTVIASLRTTVAAGASQTASLSGIITTPVGNIKLSARDPSSTNGSTKFNATGNSKDCTLSAVRIG